MSGGGSSSKVTIPTVSYSTGGLYGSGTAGASNTFKGTDFQNNLVKTTESAIPAYLPDDTHYSIVYKIADQIGASGVDGFCMRRLLWGIQAIALCQHDCQCVVVDCPPCVVVARCVVREVCFIPSYTRFVPLAARCGMAVRTVGGNRMFGI